MTIQDMDRNIPDKRLAWTTKVKEARKGTFFNYGGERVYFKIRGINAEDKITVILINYLGSDAKFYLISKDGRVWHKTIWENQMFL